MVIIDASFQFTPEINHPKFINYILWILFKRSFSASLKG